MSHSTGEENTLQKTQNNLEVTKKSCSLLIYSQSTFAFAEK